MLEPSSALQHALKADQRIVDALKTDLLHRSPLESVLPKRVSELDSLASEFAGHSAASLANVSAKAALPDWMGSNIELRRSIRDRTALRTDVDSVFRQSGVTDFSDWRLG